MGVTPTPRLPLYVSNMSPRKPSLRHIETILLISTASLLAAVAWPIVRSGVSPALDTASRIETPQSVTTVPPSPPQASTSEEEQAPLIQIAILLDTSSSMDGLIDQARGQLWRVVNEFMAASKYGKTPRLELALYEYGNDHLSLFSGYIRQVQPFTTDLDQVSEALFSLTTNGGSEHCGQVIAQAVGELQWSPRKDALKLLFIAGNEEFSQGPIPSAVAIAKAREQGVIVNTVHCGDAETGAHGGWKDAAIAGQGKYLSIDHNQEVAYVEAPQDQKIVELNSELNNTYVYFGTRGKDRLELQAKQDSNSSNMNFGSMVERSVSKSSKYYKNSSWDLVDALEQKNVDLRKIDRQTLPEHLRDKSDADLKAYIEQQKEKRDSIRHQIQQLQIQRQAFLASQARENGQQDSALDEAMISAIRAQAHAAGFQFTAKSP